MKYSHFLSPPATNDEREREREREISLLHIGMLDQ